MSAGATTTKNARKRRVREMMQQASAQVGGDDVSRALYAGLFAESARDRIADAGKRIEEHVTTTMVREGRKTQEVMDDETALASLALAAPPSRAELNRARRRITSGAASEDASNELDDAIRAFREPTTEEAILADRIMTELVLRRSENTAELRKRYAADAAAHGVRMPPEPGDGAKNGVDDIVSVDVESDQVRATSERRILDALGKSGSGATELVRNNPMCMIPPSHPLHTFIRSHDAVRRINRSLVPKRFVSTSKRPIHTTIGPLVNEMLRINVHPFSIDVMEAAPCVRLTFRLLARNERAERAAKIAREKREEDAKIAGVPYREPDSTTVTLLTDDERMTFVIDHLKINMLLRVVPLVANAQWVPDDVRRLCPHCRVFDDIRYNSMAQRSSMRKEGTLVPPPPGTEKIGFQFMSHYYSI